MAKKEIINLDNLKEYIKEIENLFRGNEINMVEQDLILNQVLLRLKQSDKDRQAHDMISNMPLGGLLKRIVKQRDNSEDTP